MLQLEDYEEKSTNPKKNTKTTIPGVVSKQLFRRKKKKVLNQKDERDFTWSTVVVFLEDKVDDKVEWKKIKIEQMNI